MKTKIFAFAAVAVLLINAVGFAAGDTRPAQAKKAQASRLISLLPASDGIAVFDSKRFLEDALPKLLSANQPVLSSITSKMTDIENRTGIDFRKFEQVAVGVSMKPKTEKDYDFAPVVIAGGDINAGALIAMAKLASKGKYRQEKISEAAVYIFNVKDALPANRSQTKSSSAKVAMNHLKALPDEIAVTPLDRNTLAFGTIDRVRETLEAKSHVSADLTALLFAKETAVASFAFRTPEGMSKLVSLDNDELGANLDTIKYIAGSLDIAAVGTSLQLMARTAQPEQAMSLKDTLEALQILGKAVLGGSKQPDKMVYGRMIKNAKIGVNGTDITLDLLVPQADIDLLVARLK
jgi:hypothetical protein